MAASWMAWLMAYFSSRISLLIDWFLFSRLISSFWSSGDDNGGDDDNTPQIIRDAAVLKRLLPNFKTGKSEIDQSNIYIYRHYWKKSGQIASILHRIVNSVSDTSCIRSHPQRWKFPSRFIWLSLKLFTNYVTASVNWIESPRFNSELDQ